MMQLMQHYQWRPVQRGLAAALDIMQEFFRLSLLVLALFSAGAAFAANGAGWCPEKNTADIALGTDKSDEYLGAIKSKIASGARADAFDPFQLLFLENHGKALERKLRGGFDINSCGGPFDSSILGLAALLGELDDVKMLVERGANLEFPKDANGQSALIAAISTNSYAVANYLIGKGADTKTTYDTSEEGALHALARSPEDKRYNEAEELKLARKLMASGVSPDKKSRNPNLAVTPLMQAIIFSKPSLVELFMECGADPHIKDQKGRDAFEFARTRRDKIKAEKMLNSLNQPRPASGSCNVRGLRGSP